MNNSYKDLISQSYHFPQDSFDLHENNLRFNGVDLSRLIEKYGTPLRLMYLPKINEQIQKARGYFKTAIEQTGYQGDYQYCYCTKCSHFSHVVRTALKSDVAIETSSGFDIDLIERLLSNDRIDHQHTLVHNGFKTDDYLRKIGRLLRNGFTNSITVLDSLNEIDRLEKLEVDRPIRIGLRISIEEEPQAAYYTSRLGINKNEVMELIEKKIKDNPKFELVMVHFFVDSGINDSLYYWGEFTKALTLYEKIKKAIPGLNKLNIGGGFPIRNSLGFDYDYGQITQYLVSTIKDFCDNANIQHPDIYTEFGKYTVGESGAVIFKVLEQKLQNSAELWYLVDNSLMNTIPDAWSINEKFILLPVNKWDNPYQKVNIGGISCDHSDYYNSEELNQQVLLPTYPESDPDPLYIGFFHTGAYQDAISGYGGIKHCLIPSPKQIVVDIDEDGNHFDYLYREEQSVHNMLDILGYND